MNINEYGNNTLKYSLFTFQQDDYGQKQNLRAYLYNGKLFRQGRLLKATTGRTPDIIQSRRAAGTVVAACLRVESKAKRPCL